MAVARLYNYKPKARSLWVLVRRLLLRKNHRPPPAPAAVEDKEEEKSGLLSRSSLEELMVMSDAAPADDGAAICRCAKKHGRQVSVAVAMPPPARLQRPVLDRAEPAPETAVFVAAGGRDGAAAVPVHRRFMFGGFRRRLLMRRPWRPMLVAIPE
ncbi:hypothetical protein ACP4OV_022350 [Aristida adscensionis]